MGSQGLPQENVLGLHSNFSASASWGTDWKIYTYGAISPKKASSLSSTSSSLNGLSQQAVSDRFAELEKRDGLSQRAMQRGEAFPS